MSSRATEIYTSAVLLLGSAFFVHSIITLATAKPNTKSKDERVRKQGNTPSESDATPPLSKLVSQSSVSNMTYTATLEDCQTISSQVFKERPKLRAGALLKLIDVAAGVTARRHASLPCVTISVDSVLFLKPIYLGDLIHISASVNRAWGTSMEIGVKVTKSDESNSKQEYVSHSYLTFVAIRPAKSAEQEKQSKPTASFWDVIWPDTKDSQKIFPKINLPRVEPSSRLEARRHLLAGRRRAKRIEDANKGEARDGVSVQVKEKVRQELIDIIKENNDEKNEEEWQQNRLRAIEIEYVIRSWSRQEDGIYAKDGRVHVDLPGDEPFSHSEKEIRMTAKALGVNLPGDDAYRPNRRLSVDFFNPPWMRNRSSSTSLEKRLDRGTLQFSTSLPIDFTLTTTMHLVFPQHTNSHSIIFGGNTMSWSEEVALMACRKLRVKNVEIGRVNWKTVALDGLEFNVKVAVGELMMLSAVVIKTYAHSCEVYVMAQAEGRDGKRRFTNDALFSLALDHKHDEKVEIASLIEMPVNSALETFAAASNLRRQQRLEMKKLLTRIYG